MCTYSPDEQKNMFDNDFVKILELTTDCLISRQEYTDEKRNGRYITNAEYDIQSSNNCTCNFN